VFKRIPSQVSRYKGKNYCSRACVGKARSKELKGKPVKWTKDKIVSELRKLAEKLGHSPTDVEIKRENYALYKAIVRWFGNTNNARRAAGLPVNREFESWSKERILQEVAKLAIELGRPPTSGDIKKHNYKLYKAIQFHFGSFIECRKALGFPGRRYGHAKEIKKSARKISEELAYLVGVALGDGSIIYDEKTGTYRFTLGTIDEDFAKYVYDTIVKWCGLKPLMTYAKGSKKVFPNGVLSKTKSRFVVTLNSRDAVRILKEYANDYSWIFNQPREIKIAFIKGLWDSEGTVSNIISWCNSDKKLVKTYKILLLDALGIEAKIRKRKGRELYDVYFHKAKYIYAFYKEVGITIERKRKKIEDKIKKWENSLKAYNEYLELLKRGWSLKKIEEEIRRKYGIWTHHWYRDGCKPILLS